MLFWHGLPLGIDFRAGTLVYVKYTHPPNDSVVRAQMDRVGLHNMRIQHLVGSNDLLLDLPQQGPGDQAALDKGQIVSALQSNAQPGKQDLNNSSSLTIADYLLNKDPVHLGSDAKQRYNTIGQQIADFRDKTK